MISEEKTKQEKRKRYSAVSIIMRQLYGTRIAHLPGYILLQDVLYKHLEKRTMSLDELVRWAAEKFTFAITEEEAFAEILQVLTQNLPEPAEGPENSLEETKELLQKVVEEATDLYEKQVTYAAVTEAVRKMGSEQSLIIEQDLIKVLFEIKRGKSLEDSISKIAEEEAEPGPKLKREERKDRIKKRIRNTILLAFSSEEKLMKFAEGIDIN